MRDGVLVQPRATLSYHVQPRRREASVNLQVGDVLMGKPHEEQDAPYARIFMNGRYIPISLAPEGMFLLLAWEMEGFDDEIKLDVVALSTGDRLTIITTVESLSSNMVILRGKSVIVPESCGTVGS